MGIRLHYTHKNNVPCENDIKRRTIIHHQLFDTVDDSTLPRIDLHHLFHHLMILVFVRHFILDVIMKQATEEPEEFCDERRE